MRKIDADALKKILWDEYMKWQNAEPENAKLIAHGVHKALDYLEEMPTITDGEA